LNKNVVFVEQSACGSRAWSPVPAVINDFIGRHWENSKYVEAELLRNIFIL